MNSMSGLESIHFFEGKPQLPAEKYTGQYSEKIMSKLDCKNYGFDCNFISNGEKVGKVIKEFRKHTIQEHYIDYPEGVLMKFIRHRK
jgi:predicted small metal-binding protein